MPLKHATETLLIAVLAVVLALTGLAVAVLPVLPAGIVWWSIALILTLAYPLSLKSRRADYPFRALHFAPFILLLIRLLLDIGSSFYAGLSRAASLYSWGWAAPAVLLAFLALMVFCIRVLRQRDMRLRLLAALFLPFLFLGLFSEFTGWNDKMARLLGGKSTIIAVEPEPEPVTETGANLEPSVDAAEERWRAMLRDRELRRTQLEGSGSMAVARGPGHALSLSGTAAIVPPPPAIVASVSPPSLVSAGPGMASVALTFAALYCGILHYRARRRMVA